MENIEIYPDSEGGWRFRVKANNGEIVGASESYAAKAGATEGVEALKRALGLEEEWGVQFDSHLGRISNIYWDRVTAQAMVDQMVEEDDDARASGDENFHNPQLVRRLTTEWEGVDE